MATFASWALPETSHGTIDILDATYFSDTNTVVLVLSTGDIISVTRPNIDEGEPVIEIVGSIEEGITAARWSPDEEVLAIATAIDTFVLLTRTFDPISEANITPTDLSLSKHVSVGWGKKETQFQGKGARAQRDPTMPVHVDSGTLSESDNKKVQISWRGDGEVVSVIVIDKKPVERRTIRVYTREGTLDSVSEPVDNLVGLVSWKPSGSLIASVQRKPDGPVLVFFERNGLRRGEFSLRVGPDDEVMALDWNIDSDILAVQLKNKVQLWTTMNYHWYLKQEIFSPSGANPIYIRWHAENARTLLINYADDEFHICDFIWDVQRGATAGPTDVGLAMVVDGQNINLTPLSLANTPPPMYFRNFQVSSTPIHLAVSRSNKIIAVLTRSGLEIAEWDPSLASAGVRHVKDPKIVSSFPYEVIFPNDEYPKQIAFIGNKIIAIAADQQRDEDSQVLLLKLVDGEGDDKYAFDIISVHELYAPVYLLKSTPALDFAFFEIIDGTVFSFQDELQQIAKITEFPRLCDAVEVYFPVGEEVVAPVAFGLSNTGKVYVNERQIAPSGTSLCMTDKYVIFTTAQHYLKFCHLTSDPAKIEVPADNAVDDERCRAIERGSLLVTAMPSRTALALQAPRGNLETIYPRVMVLTGVRNAILNLQYDKAFADCRVHRIDLNILYDYNPKQFFEQLELFVKQLGSVEYLDLFLSGLREEDVTKTMYRSTIENIESTEESTSPANKVNEICNKIVALLTTDPYKEKYLQSVLTSYACMSPPALEDALTLVGKLRESDKKLTEFSIQHLCFLQDVNLLYDTALGIYDLPLTLLVAQQSQKDPKEYLPFLRELNKQTLIRRKFEIDSYLKRYTKALQYLSEIGEEAFDELQDFVVEHELYKEALAIYKYNAKNQDAILKLYASFLHGKMEYSQAGLIYEHLGDYSNALDLYELSGEWQQSLSIAAKAYGAEELDEKMTELANHLAELTLESRKYRDSATIYLEYLNNAREAARILCKGFLFNDALRVVAQQPASAQQELVDEVITPGILEGFTQITELVSDCKGQINSQISRLEVLRLKKEEDPLAFFGQDESDAPDNVSIAESETSTAPSFITRYTGKTAGTAKTGASRRTAKNRRREERKRARGKKGSIYEEEYLINSMGRLVDRLHEQQPDAIRLIEALLRHAKASDNNMRTYAFQIQKAYVEVLDLLKEKVEYVFTMTERDRQRYDEEGNMYLIPLIPVPVIKPFPKLAMLDF